MNKENCALKLVDEIILDITYSPVLYLTTSMTLFFNIFNRWFKTVTVLCVIAGFLHDVNEIFVLLRYNESQSGS